MALTLGTLVTAQPESIGQNGGDVTVSFEATAIGKKTFLRATYRIDDRNPFVFSPSDDDDPRAVTGDHIDVSVDPHDFFETLSIRRESPSGSTGKFVTVTVEVAEVNHQGERVRLPSGRLKSIQTRPLMIPIDKD